mmetsp:Transcript_56228/g.144762  ORF Transcript_56228/g.144762 Transcript_56228/m.144762 type:complete len:351 (+) Transcript_56228:53-1105(+)
MAYRTAMSPPSAPCLRPSAVCAAADVPDFSLPFAAVGAAGTPLRYPSLPPVDLSSIPDFMLPPPAALDFESVLADEPEGDESCAPGTPEGPQPVPARRPSEPPVDLRSMPMLQLPVLAMHDKDCPCSLTLSSANSFTSTCSPMSFFGDELSGEGEDAEGMIFVMDGYDEEEPVKPKRGCVEEEGPPYECRVSAAFATALDLGEGNNIGDRWSHRAESPRTSPRSTVSSSDSSPQKLSEVSHLDMRPSPMLEHLLGQALVGYCGHDANMNGRSRTYSAASASSDCCGIAGYPRESACSTRTPSPVVLGTDANSTPINLFGKQCPSPPWSRTWTPVATSLSRTWTPLAPIDQ